jgi:hypothetical protein
VIIAVLIIGVCCISFVVTLYKSLFGRTRLNVSRQSILCLSGRREVRRLGIENIAHIGSRAFPYAVSNRITVPNYVLYARLNGGEDVPLCLTSVPDQISLIERHVARMGYQIDVQGPP